MSGSPTTQGPRLVGGPARMTGQPSFLRLATISRGTAGYLCLSRRRTTALSSFLLPSAQRQILSNGTMKVLPSLVREYSTTRDLDRRVSSRRSCRELSRYRLPTAIWPRPRAARPLASSHRESRRCRWCGSSISSDFWTWSTPTSRRSRITSIPRTSASLTTWLRHAE
jgi:hypothetical protein